MSAFTGTHHLVRLILRRDRIRLPIWIGGATLLTAVSANAVQGFYDTPAKVAGYGATVNSSAAGKFMNGRPYDVDTISGITSYEVSATTAVIVALMVVFLVVRHTRAEEESGRDELLRSTVMGRHAATGAAVLVAVAASLLVGALDAAVLIGVGLDPAGSVLHGASLAALGVAFTALAAAASQLTSSARAALGIAGGAVGALFVLRGAGDVTENFLTWLSPFGWAQAIRPYGDAQWWPVAALLVVAAALFGVTVYLTAHRDAGAGLIQPRSSRARARAGLGTAMGLSFRLQRGLVVGWAIGLVITGVLFGSFGREVVAMVESNPEMGDILVAEGATVLNGYFAYVLSFLAVITSAFTVTSVLRLRAEEDSGRAEALLATGLSRVRWVVGGLAVTVVATLLDLVLVGLSVGLTHALLTEETDVILTLLGAMLAQAPAVFAVASVAVLVFGWLPRWSLLAWVPFAFALLQSYLGGLLRLSDEVSALSPFWHLPSVPAESFTPGPAVVITVIAAVLAAAGVVGVRRRDIT